MLVTVGALKPPCGCWEQPARLAAHPALPMARASLWKLVAGMSILGA